VGPFYLLENLAFRSPMQQIRRGNREILSALLQRALLLCRTIGCDDTTRERGGPSSWIGHRILDK
jgi:hypothetical protein